MRSSWQPARLAWVVVMLLGCGGKVEPPTNGTSSSAGGASSVGTGGAGATASCPSETLAQGPKLKVAYSEQPAPVPTGGDLPESAVFQAESSTVYGQIGNVYGQTGPKLLGTAWSGAVRFRPGRWLDRADNGSATSSYLWTVTNGTLLTLSACPRGSGGKVVSFSFDGQRLTLYDPDYTIVYRRIKD